MGQLDDLLGELASEGTRAASGSFGIDAERAREKMQQFQLANPYTYVCELVQAAHLLGASRISFTVDADELWMRFDGSPFSSSELGELYSAAMSARDNPRARANWHIAIAFNALTRLNPKKISITSALADDVEEHARLDFTSEDEFEVVSLEDDDRFLDAGMMEIYVRERVRLDHFVEFFSKFVENLPEVAIVKDSCALASIPIEINGEVISGGLKPPGWLSRHHTFERDGIRGVIGAFSSGFDAKLEILQHGVLIKQMVRKAPIAPFFCRVEANHLNRDLSLSAFVEDEHWNHLFFDVLAKEVRFALLEELRARDKGNHTHWPDWAYELARVLFKERAELGGHNPLGSVELEILNELKYAPVWPIAYRPPLLDVEFEREGNASIIELRRALNLKGGEPILYASSRGGPHWPGKLNLIDSEDARAVAHFMGLEYKSK